MKYLVDTNVLLRWAHVDSAGHSVCTDAVGILLEAGHEVCMCAQVLIEFRAVATRPMDKNGLGLSVPDVIASTADLRGMFTLLPEPPDIADRWQAIADHCLVQGKQAHDARIAALMIARGVTHLLTLNPRDFVRYEEITSVTPQEVLQRGS